MDEAIESLKEELLEVLEMKLIAMIAMQTPVYKEKPVRLDPKRRLSFSMLLEVHRCALRHAVLNDEYNRAEQLYLLLMQSFWSSPSNNASSLIPSGSG